jgi:hypothetical protein
MNAIEIVTQVLLPQVFLSASFTAAAAFLIRKYVEKRVEHDFNLKMERIKHEHALEIETLKARLSTVTSATSKVSETRLTSYQTLGDTIYRLRNILRDIRDGLANGCGPTIQEDLTNHFCEQVNELKETLFKSRVTISDGAFQVCHKFKTLAVRNAIVLDFLIGAEDPAAQFSRLLNYAEFDRIHTRSVKQLRIEIGSADGN